VSVQVSVLVLPTLLQKIPRYILWPLCQATNQ
jgi:hypothetical protein